MNKDYYLKMRNRYHPSNLRHIFILESPPDSGKYFYDECGKVSEFLFKAMMRFIEFTPSNKKEGLEYFQKCGYLLVDATYTPVNQLKNKKERNQRILEDFDLLLEDLSNINPEKKIPLILVKANICEILEDCLEQKGFAVLNNKTKIPFPSTGNQNKFHEKLVQICNSSKSHA